MTFPVLDGVEDFDKECIRRIIASFYERGEIPTLDAILELVKEEPVNFKGKRSTLHTLLKKMDFVFKK